MLPARRIRPAERDAALGTVVEAFRADPQARWYFPDDGWYEEAAVRFFGVLLDTRIDGGEVWVVDDLSAVSMWLPPGGNLVGPDVVAARYAEVVATLPDPAPRRIAATDDLVDVLLPDEAYWYLGVLACRPECRGRGLATAVTRPIFAAADRARLPVALETCTRGNVDYYTRRGFAVIATRTAGGPDGLAVTVMRRAPSPTWTRSRA